jgi:hypothetical protein
MPASAAVKAAIRWQHIQRKTQNEQQQQPANILDCAQDGLKRVAEVI